MLKVGITGNIGSGKSLICDIFRIYGIPVYDADLETRLLMETNETIISLVKKEFGEESYIDDKLNRSYLAKLVFSFTECYYPSCGDRTCSAMDE